MKSLSLIFISLFLAACSSKEDYAEQPVAPWTYPIMEYRVIKKQAGRTGEKNITRLVGWDKGFYFFDWAQEGAVIGRGTGRVERNQFDLENNGALTLEKGRVKLSGGQVRTLVFE